MEFMRTLKFLVISIALLCSILSQAQTNNVPSEVRKKHFLLNRQGVALDGYDPVSYFSNQPTKGKSEFSTTYKGIIYYFISNENKIKFDKNPDNFEPEYGGWCAYAMGLDGDKVEVDPKRFKIINGKINLFYNGIFGDTLKPWNEKEKELIPKANANWKNLFQ